MDKQPSKFSIPHFLKCKKQQLNEHSLWHLKMGGPCCTEKGVIILLLKHGQKVLQFKTICTLHLPQVTKCAAGTSKWTSLYWNIVLQDSTLKGALMYYIQQKPSICASARSQRLYGKLFYNSKQIHSLWIPRNMTLVDKSFTEPHKSLTKSILACTPLKDKNKSGIWHKPYLNKILLSLALKNLNSSEYHAHVKALIPHITSYKYTIYTLLNQTLL